MAALTTENLCDRARAWWQMIIAQTERMRCHGQIALHGIETEVSDYDEFWLSHGNGLIEVCLGEGAHGLRVDDMVIVPGRRDDGWPRHVRVDHVGRGEGATRTAASGGCSPSPPLRQVPAIGQQRPDRCPGRN